MMGAAAPAVAVIPVPGRAQVSETTRGARVHLVSSQVHLPFPPCMLVSARHSVVLSGRTAQVTAPARLGLASAQVRAATAGPTNQLCAK